MKTAEKKMRLSPQIAEFLKKKITDAEPSAKVFLFGSRTDLYAKGGDIDIMIITENNITGDNLASIRREFFTKFGWQKLDIAFFKPNDQSPFFKLISPTAIPL